jgi:uncharacterized protein (DUF3084 family)
MTPTYASELLLANKRIKELEDIIDRLKLVAEQQAVILETYSQYIEALDKELSRYKAALQQCSDQYTSLKSTSNE